MKKAALLYSHDLIHFQDYKQLINNLSYFKSTFLNIEEENILEEHKVINEKIECFFYSFRF